MDSDHRESISLKKRDPGPAFPLFPAFRSICLRNFRIPSHGLSHIGPVHVSAGLPPSDFAGGYAEFDAEQPGKIVGIVEPVFQSHFLHRIPAGSQGVVGHVQLLCNLVLVEAAAHHFSKSGGESPLVHLGHFGSRREGQLPARLVADDMQSVHNPSLRLWLTVRGEGGQLIQEGL